MVERNEWSQVGGGGVPNPGFGIPAWNAFARPTGLALAQDDYFDSGLTVLDPKWQLFDHGGILAGFATQNPDLRCAQLDAQGNGADRWCGIVQPVPAGEFLVYTYVTGRFPLQNFYNLALAVLQDPSNAAADLVTVESAWSAGGGNVICGHWSAWNGARVLLGSLGPGFAVCPTGWFARIRFLAGTLHLDASIDGFGWIHIVSVAPGWNPSHLGLVFNPVHNSGVRETAFFRFCKVFSGAGSSTDAGTSIGRVVGV